jgi:uncharacterized protein (DUF427 family)
VENVWDYPRPPALEPVTKPVRIIFAGITIAETSAAYRVLETSHPPVYYLPPAAFLANTLVPAPGGSFCEWKGRGVELSRPDHPFPAHPRPHRRLCRQNGLVCRR